MSLIGSQKLELDGPGQDCGRQSHVVPQGLGAVVSPSQRVGSCQDGCPGIQRGLQCTPEVKQHRQLDAFMTIPLSSLLLLPRTAACSSIHSSEYRVGPIRLHNYGCSGQLLAGRLERQHLP